MADGRDGVTAQGDQKSDKVVALRPDLSPTKSDQADTGLGLPDDRILGEISHEMGNYFHKLYYWTDYLKTRSGAGQQTDAGAADMLVATVERLERFMRMILEYFAPARLCFHRLTAGDLLAGLSNRLSGRTLKVVGLDEWGETSVMADPALIGHAIRTVFERVATTLLDEDEMVVRLTSSKRSGFAGIDIEFEAGGGLAASTHLTQGIEMAVAEKFLQMHGGEVFERNEGGRSLIVFLPIYT
jgi:hypothetical protein